MRRSQSRQFGLRLKPEKIPWIRRGIIAVLLVALAINLLPPPQTEASSRGDGRLFYGEASVQTPRYRDWTNSTNTFSSESNVPGSGSSVHHMQTAASPKRDEMVAAYSKQDLFSNQLQVYVWNGSSWTLGWQASIGYNSSAPRFDVVYSESTGKAFVVYSRNTGTTNELAYRTYDGSSWSAETTYDAQRTSNTIAYVKALTRPGTDEIAVIWADDSNMDMSGNYFNAATSTWSGEPAAALSTNIARVGNGTSVNSDFADMAFENTSGRLVVCWGDEDVTDMKCSIRTAGTGGTWGAVQTHTSFAATPVDMKMTAEPGSNYIAYNNAQDDDTTTRSVEAAIWDGSAWGSINNYDTSINSVGSAQTNVSVDWVKSGAQSRAVATYDDSVSTAIDWAVYDKASPGSGWVVQTDISDSPAPGNLDDHMHMMRHNPYNQSELMFFIRDFGEDLIAKKITFNGSTISWSSTSPSGVLETDMQSGDLNYGWGLDFSYFLYTDVIDGTTHVTANTHDGTAPNSVFINDQDGYVFYRDSTGNCAYSRTSNGGKTWGAAVSVAASTCLHVTIWYDRWTPGDSTGNYIYILAARLPSAGVGDLVYNRLDTTNDTLEQASPVTITASPGPAKTNEFRSDDNYPSISKATNGNLFVGVQDSGTAGDQSYVLKCTTTCGTASNWADTGAVLPENTDTQARNNATLLLPQASGNMLMVAGDGTNNTVRSSLYTEAGGTWGSWINIDTSATYNATYAANNISAVVDRRNFTVHVAFTHDAGTLGTDDDIRTATYSGGSWTDKTDVITNTSRGVIAPQIALDENTGALYVAYIARTTAATATTANIYWKQSTDAMTTWGTEQGTVNTTPNDLWGIRLNPMSNERLFVNWTDAASSSAGPRALRGDTVADLVQPTFDQSAYRVFDNANSTDMGTALAAQDTSASVAATTNFRLRMLLHMTAGDGARINYDDFKLQFVDKGSGTCAAPSGGTPASYTDVTASSVIAYQNNTTPSDGANLTANVNDPTHSGHTVRNQTYEELNPFSNTVAAIASGEDAQWDFSLRDNTGVVGSSYCFRIVKNSDTQLATYSQYPEVTLTSTNQAPNVAASLVQKKTNDTTLATGDWTNESSVKFTANVSDPDSSDTLQLCVEKKPLGTSFDSNAGAETCGTGVAYSGTPAAASVTINSHSDDQYHWQARVKDAAGSYSSWTAYGSNAESVRDYGVDTTAPTGGTVYDGTSIGSDAAFSTSSLTTLSANWSGFNANISGLNRYEYSIGTTPGGTSIKNWTNEAGTSVTVGGLTLRTTQPYYFNVRAVDEAGNTSSVISSDGQLVLPSLSFGISSSSIAFDNLNAGNSYTDTKTTTVTTSTNAYNGYAVRAFTTGLMQGGATTLPAFAGGSYASPDSWQGGDTGFGYTSNDTSIQGVNKFQDDPCPGGSALASPGCYAPFSQTQPGDIVADHTANVSGSPIANEPYIITYRVTADGTQAAKSYTTNIVYSVVPVY